MITATQIRPGMILVVDGKLYRVMKTQHVTPGKGNALMQTELRDLRSGNKIEKRFRPSESVERAYLQTKEMEFLYSEGDDYHFMDTETYEQVHMTATVLGTATHYLQANTKITVDLYEGEAIGVELPSAMEQEIIETDPPLKGATASSSGKPAKLDNGITVKVPAYLKVGDRIRVNPATDEYIERV